MKLSVVYATRNEELHIGEGIKSVKDIADEIILVDEYSKDKTREIAKKLGARVFLEPHHKIFHITKQKAIEKASGDWILQLDADERVTPSLAIELKKIINMEKDELEEYEENLKEKKLFLRHQKLIEGRDGTMGDKNAEYVAFFIPRSNYYLGKYLKYGGTYPDGVIRLFKKGKAYLPGKDVHEQLVVNGRVGWLANHLEHVADKTFKQYLKRNSYYIDLMVGQMKKDKVNKDISNFFRFMIIIPIWWFLKTLVRHKGILDGWQGMVFSFFSALRFPRAYIRYNSK